MDLAYFKRYRMEIDLVDHDLTPSLPAGYRFLPWEPSLLEAFAEAKYLSFRDEIDANVFPCLGELAGCRRLMPEISQKPGFLPEATWLVEHAGGRARRRSAAARSRESATSRTGGHPERGHHAPHRNGGLGTVLLLQALAGFRRAGLPRVYLEVTAENDGAIRLYRRLGFVTVKTVFKAVEAAYLYGQKDLAVSEPILSHAFPNGLVLVAEPMAGCNRRPSRSWCRPAASTIRRRGAG